ncbi:FAS1-like dehydratase domain-containing protein [Altererythrobacter sp. Z27]|uniref:FAS1-like dehydratase domain-containing protein n=1 Tax=Altererythrobacter sp. Z27 TaxID=3461147 RepID=UPI004044C446
MTLQETRWQDAWRPVIALVGQPLSGPEPVPGAEQITAEAIRRYLEPLEFDCPLHYDTATAQQFGYPQVIAPYTSVTSFALGELWRPGEPLFIDDGYNSQPARTNVRPFAPEGMPPVTGYFATEVEMDFVRPPFVGDRLTRENPVLLSCEPKQTRVGRGAFLTLESQIVDQDGDLVATVRSTVYFYEPVVS